MNQDVDLYQYKLSESRNLLKMRNESFTKAHKINASVAEVVAFVYKTISMSRRCIRYPLSFLNGVVSPSQ